MKRTFAAALVLMAAMGVTACETESTSTTSVNFSTTKDGETTEYSYNSENHNGEVTTDSSVTTSSDDGDEAEDAVVAKAEEIAELLENEWDSEDGDGHHVSCDPDWIYVQVWQGDVSDYEILDEEAFADSVIPTWLDATAQWREDMDEAGLSDVGVTLQYTLDDGESVVFTIDDAELTYNYFEE